MTVAARGLLNGRGLQLAVGGIGAKLRSHMRNLMW